MNPEGDTFENDTHWLPKPHDECQFKVCHNCRHGSAERAFLCLDGIANDEIPMTAVSGFGFNLHGKRPAILRKHAINFGLRPSPNPQTVSNLLFPIISHYSLHILPMSFGIYSIYGLPLLDMDQPRLFACDICRCFLYLRNIFSQYS